MKQMGIVLQEPYLFSGTIAENIKYANVKASDAKMVEVAKLVGAHEFIMRQKDNYNLR